MPKRIQLRRVKGWRLPASAVNVARPGPWGNPFVIDRDGTREECIALYAALLAGSICATTAATEAQQRKVQDHAARHFGDLRGKDLACWCRLDGRPCHADVLLRLANGEKPAP
jgi:Domain of unknown function (DUF4326)